MPPFHSREKPSRAPPTDKRCSFRIPGLHARAFYFCTRITVQTKIFWRTTGFPVSFFASLFFFLLVYRHVTSPFVISVCRHFVILLRFGMEIIIDHFLLLYSLLCLEYKWLMLNKYQIQCKLLGILDIPKNIETN